MSAKCIISTREFSHLAQAAAALAGLSLGLAAAAQTPPTRAQCLANAQAAYTAAMNTCHSRWASDPDPYLTCINDAGYAHATAAKACERIVKRPPALPPRVQAAPAKPRTGP